MLIKLYLVRFGHLILNSDKNLEKHFKIFIAAYQTTFAKPTALLRHLGFAKALIKIKDFNQRRV